MLCGIPTADVRGFPGVVGVLSGSEVLERSAPSIAGALAAYALVLVERYGGSKEITDTLDARRRRLGMATEQELRRFGETMGMIWRRNPRLAEAQKLAYLALMATSMFGFVDERTRAQIQFLCPSQEKCVERNLVCRERCETILQGEEKEEEEEGDWRARMKRLVEIGKAGIIAGDDDVAFTALVNATK